LNPFEYYALCDENGVVIKSSFTNDFSPSAKQKIKKMRYLGCAGKSHLEM
jgi:hypothetical protein